MTDNFWFAVGGAIVGACFSSVVWWRICDFAYRRGKIDGYNIVADAFNPKERINE